MGHEVMNDVPLLFTRRVIDNFIKPKNIIKSYIKQASHVVPQRKGHPPMRRLRSINVSQYCIASFYYNFQMLYLVKFLYYTTKIICIINTYTHTHTHTHTHTIHTYRHTHNTTPTTHTHTLVTLLDYYDASSATSNKSNS